MIGRGARLLGGLTLHLDQPGKANPSRPRATGPRAHRHAHAKSDSPLPDSCTDAGQPLPCASTLCLYLARWLCLYLARWLCPLPCALAVPSTLRVGCALGHAPWLCASGWRQVGSASCCCPRSPRRNLPPSCTSKPAADGQGDQLGDGIVARREHLQPGTVSRRYWRHLVKGSWVSPRRSSRPTVGRRSPPQATAGGSSPCPAGDAPAVIGIFIIASAHCR